MEIVRTLVVKNLALLKLPTKLSEVSCSGKRLYYKRYSKLVVFEDFAKDQVL